MLSSRLAPVLPLRVVRSNPATSSLTRAACDAATVSLSTSCSHAAGSAGSSRPCFPTAVGAVGAVTLPGCAGRPGRSGLQVRGKKTRTVARLADLPQGPIPRAEPLPAGARQQQQQQQEEEAAAPGASSAAPAYPTVVQQARRNMQKFDNCVLLTRVGGFYELYFEQADEYGPLLNLKVAQKKTSAGPVPMAGFPFFQLDRFLKILVQDLNRYVAVAEEFPNDASEKVKSGGLMHDRRVARIITPGTLIDENFMDPYANNYVMAVHLPAPGPGESHEGGDGGPGGPGAAAPEASPRASMPVGLAWLDLSTGHFFTQCTTLSSLGSILSRVCPREVILDENLQSQRSHDVFSILADERHLITYAAQAGELRTLADWAPMLEAEIPAQSVDAFTDDEVRAGCLLLHYVKDRLRGISMKLQPPLRHQSMQVMSIDKNSMRSLEIKQTIRDSAFRGSLLHAIRRTVTKSGARLLNEWLSAPSTSLEVIGFRQDLVARFIRDEALRDNIILLLRRSHDSQRLVQKFALGRGDPDDLLGLASTIKATQDIVSLLTEASASDGDGEPASGCLKVMVGRIHLEGPVGLARRIAEAIDEEGVVQRHRIEDSEAGDMMALAQEIVDAEGTAADSPALPKVAAAAAAAAAAKKKRPSLRDYYGEDNEVWIMKPRASAGLQRLHAELAGLLGEKAALAGRLQEQLGAASLTLRWTPGLGHICHVRGKDARNAAADLRAVSASRTTRSFHLPEWTRLGQRLDQARLQVRQEEQRVFQGLRQQVVRNVVRLRRSAAVLDELDIATSWARLALERGLTRPAVNRSAAHAVVGGRHPTVEGGLREAGRTFTRNDCFVGSPGHGRAWLVTGPNMAGKSTFLRQNALITVLAQAGCYVPADHAELGVVDALFSRVGSADDLYRDQSTFMVEMLETARILRDATPRSLVVMDEVGRGTTPEDGAAVAFAALHHLVRANKCRTLFATHFHAVADLAEAQGMMMTAATAATAGAGAVEAYCTDVEEDGRGGFAYVHRLRRGVNRQSHALKVARLAGLPEAAIRVARQVLGGSGDTLGTEDGQHVTGGDGGATTAEAVS